MATSSDAPPGALRRGAGLALLSAVLFGASTPCAKALLDGTDPWMLAALLYLGSGLGLAVLDTFGRVRNSARLAEAPLAGAAWLWFGGAILFGGVVGPVLLMLGLAHTPASTASLLLNLESVLSVLLAWAVFRENVDRRIATGMLAIAAGATALSWQGDVAARGLWGPLAVIGACLAWAIDNNLTRKASLSDPIQIAMLKGLAAGTITLLLALGQGARLPTPAYLIGAGGLGFIGYGISLALYVMALRQLGTARASAYYATAPYVGAVIAVVVFDETVTWPLLIAGTLMAFGVWLHLTERHEHWHEHEPMTHTHRHRHDTHHQHAHRPDDPSGEPHVHRHAHVRLRHSHVHYPDAHHRHGHGEREHPINET